MGPSILSEVLKTAIADGKTDLAAITATALGQVIDPAALATTGRPHVLVDALYAPHQRVQFAAAKALVTLSPTMPFPGSSRVVPTLARFVMNQAFPRAVVIDSNPTRGSQIAGFLISLGYDSELELSGANGFRAAAESTDVELILISFDLFRTGWGLMTLWPTSRPTRAQRQSQCSSTARLMSSPSGRTLIMITPGSNSLSSRCTADMLLQQLKGLPAPVSKRSVLTMRVKRSHSWLRSPPSTEAL